MRDRLRFFAYFALSSWIWLTGLNLAVCSHMAADHAGAGRQMNGDACVIHHDAGDQATSAAMHTPSHSHSLEWVPLPSVTSAHILVAPRAFIHSALYSSWPAPACQLVAQLEYPRRSPSASPPPQYCVLRI